MAVDEQARGRLEAMEQRTAGAVSTEFASGMAQLRSEMAQHFIALNRRLDDQMRLFVLSMVGSMLAVAAIAFGAAQLV